MANEWDAWCRRHGVNPATDDETILDAFLHQRELHRVEYQPETFGDAVARARSAMLDAMADAKARAARAQWRDAAQCEFYRGWEAYDAAMVGKRPEVVRAQVKAEVYELERWLRL